MDGSGSNLCFAGRISPSVLRQNRGTVLAYVGLRYANPTYTLGKSTSLTHHLMDNTY